MIGDFNFFPMLISVMMINIFVFVILMAVIVIFFLQRIQKLKNNINELIYKRDEMKELLENAEQLNRNLVQESISEKENTEMIVAKMSYEIHNCVNGIMGMTNLLKDTNLNFEQKKTTEVIIDCSKKLLESAHGSFNTVINMEDKLKNTGDAANGWDRTEKISKELGRRYSLKILVAEDDAINQQLALKILEKIGYTADTASNGKEALDMVSEKNYDVILMDVLMPEMDGFEATKMIRLCLDVQPLIIAVTASAMAGDKEKCLQAGMDDYICKPIVVDELADMFIKWSQEKKVLL